MTTSISGTGGITFPDGSVQSAAASPYTMKNRIINGDFRIDQRNAGASVTPSATGSNVYNVDRWATQISVASKFSVQQSTTAPTGFSNSLKVTSLSAYTVGASDYFVVNQLIEGLNVADLAWGTANAKTVTLSFQVYSSLTGTFAGAIGNAAGNRSYPFSYTISNANTWTTVSITIVGDTTGTWLTTNGIGMYVYFNLGTGTTYSGTAGSWAAANYVSATGATSVVGTNGATFYLTGVQLEIGTSATPFERRMYGQELALCQRYLPAISSGTSGNSLTGSGYATSTTNFRVITPYFVSPRVAPTGITISSASHYTAQIAATQGTPSAIAFNSVSSSTAAAIDCTVSGFTAGQAGMLYSSNASAQILFTGCEL